MESLLRGVTVIPSGSIVTKYYILRPSSNSYVGTMGPKCLATWTLRDVRSFGFFGVRSSVSWIL